MYSKLSSKVGLFAPRVNCATLTTISQLGSKVNTRPVELNIKTTGLKRLAQGRENLQSHFNIRNSVKLGFTKKTFSTSCISKVSSINIKRADNLNLKEKGVKIGINSMTNSTIKTSASDKFQHREITSLNETNEQSKKQPMFAKFYGSQQATTILEIMIFHKLKLHPMHSTSKFFNSTLLPIFFQPKCLFTSEAKKEAVEEKKTQEKLTNYQKFKIAVKEYGPVVVVLHITISLISLGCCYIALTSGVDIQGLLKKLGTTEGSAVVATAAPFVIAYAFHKSLAPARFGLTLLLAPYVVRYLRKKGFSVKPK